MTLVSAMSRADCLACGPAVLFVGNTCLHCGCVLGGPRPRGKKAAVFNGPIAKGAALESAAQFKRQKASTPTRRKGNGSGVHGAGRA
jgi:hypothetical protein